MAQLSATMQSAIDYAMKHGGKIVRYPGGFWARESWQWYEHPWFATPTINALVDRGLAEYTAWQERKHGGSKFPIEITLVSTQGKEE